MDIKQLKFLIALDETRHFGQAAARCHITQPTLSMRLRSLEEELDLPLVNRGQRFEGFTAPGERVLAWARTVLAAYDGLQAEAAACRGNLVGTLRLGVVPLSDFDPLAMMQRLHAEHPSLRFELSSLSSERILEQLANNRIDLGISYLERLDNERFEALPFSHTRMGLLYDQRFFFFGEQPLSWEALIELPWACSPAACTFANPSTTISTAGPHASTAVANRRGASIVTSCARWTVLRGDALGQRPECADRRFAHPAHRKRANVGPAGPDHAARRPTLGLGRGLFCPLPEIIDNILIDVIY